MGQYWKAVNLDKKEYLDPHHMEEGAKLLEQAWSTGGVMTGLTLLLAPLPRPRGGGDPGDIVEGFQGRWAGDRIVFVGDYSEGDDAPHINNFGGLYEELDEDYRDISKPVLHMVRRNT